MEQRVAAFVLLFVDGECRAVATIPPARTTAFTYDDGAAPDSRATGDDRVDAHARRLLLGKPEGARAVIIDEQSVELEVWQVTSSGVVCAWRSPFATARPPRARWEIEPHPRIGI